MSIHLHNRTLASGERFPVLINEDGVPLQFPLLFSFKDRERGGVPRLQDRLRRIRELYIACCGMGFDLDHAILYQEVDVRDIESAIYWLEDEPEIFATSASMRNRRISAWSDFVAWALERSNWTLKSSPARDRAQRDSADRLRLILDDLRLPVAASRQVFPLTSREIQVLDSVLGPGADGSYPRSPFKGEGARRAWVLYQLLRYGGFRLGEALKLKVSDVPSRAKHDDPVEVLIREAEGSAMLVTLRRRVDDPEDSRANEPRVKRLGRQVPLPDQVIELLWDYIDDLSGDVYLIRTLDYSRPLSYSGASKLHYKIRPHAARLFEERYPGDSHSLNDFRWHRLRHTRAVEELPKYFPDGQVDPFRIRAYCDAFGWATLESADPYLRLFHRAKGDELWQSQISHLDQ